MAESNPNARLEAFCDGVFSVALTLLIIDIRLPATTAIRTTSDLWLALRELLPSIFAFLLSFAIIFILWTNHHATLKLVDKTSSLVRLRERLLSTHGCDHSVSHRAVR